MSEPLGAPLAGTPAMPPPGWLDGLGREGLAIVVLVAFVTSLNTTTKFLVTLPLGQWLGAFLDEFVEYLLVGSAILIAAVWARKAVPSSGAKQYAAMAFAVVMAATLAEVSLEAWSTNGRLIEPGENWQSDLLDAAIELATYIIRDSFVGLIIASTWLYVRAEADHAAAIAAVAVDSERLDRQTAEARLQMLEAQIEPHFLFNTLANVKRLYETDRTAGATMMRNLKDYLSVALPQMRAIASTLGRESDHAIAYLNIQKTRMGRRLAFAFDIPVELRNARLPSLMLLTLVENSVKHGLTPRPQGGRIDVKARVVDGQLRIDVADTGQGFTKSGGGGTGLANTRARLASYFGDRASLSLALNAPRGVIATLVLPYENASCDRGAW
ncbi:MAG: sensor histidine kinase [Candidatus Levyibacteriota bacterium]